jgi:hypothetical protein
MTLNLAFQTVEDLFEGTSGYDSFIALSGAVKHLG